MDSRRETVSENQAPFDQLSFYEQRTEEPEAAQIQVMPNHEARDDLHREMKPRQLNMMAIAGAIGTGLILGSGSGLARGGPASLLIAYILMGFIVYIVMVCLAEMGAFLPDKKSFSGYATRFVDPALGFATGWNYFCKYSVVLPNNLTATGILLQYWLPDINVSVWIATFGISILIVNLIHVRVFGEVEFWLSMIKALVIFGLILICLAVSFGGGPSQTRTGFEFWHDPGAFAEYLVPGTTGRFLGAWNSIIQATFAYLGTELVAVAFGETPDPRKNVPRAVNQTLVRIVIFYVAAVLVLGMAVPYNSPQLLAANKAKMSGAASPFVVAASGISGLPAAINGLLLVFTVSAANSDIYLASRSIWALAKNKQAPAIFHHTNKRGVPVPAVLLSVCFAALGFMNATKGSSTVFGYLVSLTTVFGAINWISVLYSYLCMVQAMKVQGVSRSKMPYRNILLPWGAYFALAVTVLVIIFNGFAAFIPVFQVDKFITSYIGIVIFMCNILIWKLLKKTNMVRSSEVDLITGRRE